VRFDPDVHEPLALVVAFHGYGDAGAAGMERDTGFSDGATAGSYIVAYPRALGSPPSWKFDEASDVAFVQGLIRVPPAPSSSSTAAQGLWPESSRGR
jgi:poly(3-hydroxybutyrate) depolymerase